MEEFIQGCFSWPSFPATILLLMVCAYWMLVMLGALSLEFLDFDFEFDADLDVDASIFQIGFVPLKWLNIGSVPTMLWISIFTFCAWMVSRLANSPAPHETFEWASDFPAIARDFGVSLFLTKCITQPLRGRFDPVEPNKPEDIIGQVCVVSTGTVTNEFGQALLSTDGAPLRLNVRTNDEALKKNDEAVIVGFDAETNLYFVTLNNTN